MNINIEKSFARGFSDLVWLRSGFSFSFAEYRNFNRMGFSSLRVFNDDTIAPSKGFDMHSHSDMEIVTILLKGAIAHKDSIGHESIMYAPSVQKMSAGSGIYHSEFNASSDEELKLFQIWIKPEAKGIEPHYAGLELSYGDFTNKFLTIASNEDESNVLKLHQKAKISRGFWSEAVSLDYKLLVSSNVFIFVVSGMLKIDNNYLFERDSAEISSIENLKIEITKNTEIVVIEV
ncbi:MAG: hypothetical protein RL154_1580 [Pseudomonadota bacterium]|jgi:redox-sensitive bicupin YhaK (pirin superfamily)